MTTLSIITFTIISAFAIGFYCHYTADRFAFFICLRDNITRETERRIKVVIDGNVKRMIKLEQAIKKAGKGSGIAYMLKSEWNDLRSYNIALNAI